MLKKIGILQYKILFGNERIAIADYYLNHMGDRMRMFEIQIFHQEDVQPYRAGFLMGSPEEDVYEVRYLYILPDLRKRGYACRALEELEKVIPERQISIRLPESLKTYTCMEHFMQKLHYQLCDVVHLFQCYRDDFSSWQVYMKLHGQKILDYMKEEGFTGISLAQAPRELVYELEHSLEDPFQNEMNPLPILSGKQGELLDDFSWLVEKEGHLAAYCLVLRGDTQSLIFEQISASVQYQGSGAVFMAFVYALETYRMSSYKKTAYAVYESNVKSMAIAKRLLRNVTSIEKKQFNFCKKLTENDVNFV